MREVSIFYYHPFPQIHFTIFSAPFGEFTTVKKKKEKTRKACPWGTPDPLNSHMAQDHTLVVMSKYFIFFSPSLASIARNSSKVLSSHCPKASTEPTGTLHLRRKSHKASWPPTQDEQFLGVCNFLNRQQLCPAQNLSPCNNEKKQDLQLQSPITGRCSEPVENVADIAKIDLPTVCSV